MDVSMPVCGITPSRYGRARKTRARVPPPATKECGCNLTVGKLLMKNAKVCVFYLYTIDKNSLTGTPACFAIAWTNSLSNGARCLSTVTFLRRNGPSTFHCPWAVDLLGSFLNPNFFKFFNSSFSSWRSSTYSVIWDSSLVFTFANVFACAARPNSRLIAT